MSLNATQISMLNQADSSSVQKVFTLLRGNWGMNCWLSKNNRYKLNCIEKIKSDSTRNKIIHKHIKEYIAASTVTHCMDGWCYLGRAIHSYMYGDSDIAKHIAYYAELRAAMSLLASEGIGVFDRKHYVIRNASKQTHMLNGDGTHVFVWDALKNWIEQPEAYKLILQIPVAEGMPLINWFNMFNARPATLSGLAKKLLLEWGLDLSKVTGDKESRNLVSYRPTAFNSSGSISVRDALEFVFNLWRLCEPLSSMKFRLLDRYLLRKSLGIIFKATHPTGRSVKQAPIAYKKQIAAMFNQFNPSEWSNEKWEKFLTYKHDTEEPLLLEEAQAKSNTFNSHHTQQVLSRATLLLRIATGACGILLKQIPDFSRALQFWWLSLGKDHAVWGQSSSPASAMDLWEDGSEAIQAINNWLQTTSGGEVSYGNLQKVKADSIAVLGSCERIGMWGLGL